MVVATSTTAAKNIQLYSKDHGLHVNATIATIIQIPALSPV